MSNKRETITQTLMRLRPNLTGGTIRTYLSIIKRASKELGKNLETTSDILDNIDKILDYVFSIKYNVRKTKVSALISILDEGENNDKTRNSILNKLRKQLNEDCIQHENKMKSQELSDRQKKFFKPWSNILGIYEELKSEAEPLFKFKELNLKQFNKLTEYVLASCYILIAPRRSEDYASFKIRNFDESETSKDNYMTIIKKKPYFVFNTFKNASRIGSQIIPIPIELKNIITKFKSKSPYEYLITNRDGKRISQPKIHFILSSIFGDGIGSSMLRHIYLTHKYGDVNLKELSKDTEEMGSSEVKTILNYVSKDDAEKK